MSRIKIIDQTDEEKLAMYMEKCSKEELAKMLIECNKCLKVFTLVVKKVEPNKRSVKTD